MIISRRLNGFTFPQIINSSTRVSARFSLLGNPQTAQGGIATQVIDTDTFLSNGQYNDKMYRYSQVYNRVRFAGFTLYVKHVADEEFLISSLSSGVVVGNKFKSQGEAWFHPDTYSDDWSGTGPASYQVLEQMKQYPKSVKLPLGKNVCCIKYRVPGVQNSGSAVKVHGSDFPPTSSSTKWPNKVLQDLIQKWTCFNPGAPDERLVPDNFRISVSNWPSYLPTAMSPNPANTSINHQTHFELTAFFHWQWMGVSVSQFSN